MHNPWIAKGREKYLLKTEQFNMLINKAMIQGRARLAGDTAASLTLLLVPAEERRKRFGENGIYSVVA